MIMLQLNAINSIDCLLTQRNLQNIESSIFIRQKKYFLMTSNVVFGLIFLTLKSTLMLKFKIEALILTLKVSDLYSIV